MTTTPEIPEAAVQAGARALNDDGWTCFGGVHEPGQYDDCDQCKRVCDRQSRAALTAAWPHLHPTITTDEELNALPRGTVVRSNEGSIACRYDDVFGVVFGDDRPFAWSRLDLPATVLYRGDAQ